VKKTFKLGFPLAEGAAQQILARVKLHKDFCHSESLEKCYEFTNSYFSCYSESIDADEKPIKLDRFRIKSGMTKGLCSHLSGMTDNVKSLFTYPLINLSTLKKNAAFTLAEVLITLGIIGVVAALTIPGLINNYKAARLHSQFLKSYSTVQQAFKQMESDDVSLDPADYDQAKFYKAFMKYLQAPFDCGYLSGNNMKRTKPCYDSHNSTTPYRTFDGKSRANNYRFDDGQIALQDGTLLLFENWGGGVWVSVDLNGYNNPPNRWGYDLFTFQFIDGELVTMGDKKSDYTDMSKYCSATSTDSLNGIACAQKAKENSDYFKELIKEFK